MCIVHCAEFRVEQILSCNVWVVAGALSDHSWPTVIIIAYTHLIFNSFSTAIHLGISKKNKLASFEAKLV